jgi:hypothetical protein
MLEIKKYFYYCLIKIINLSFNKKINRGVNAIKKQKPLNGLESDKI